MKASAIIFSCVTVILSALWGYLAHAMHWSLTLWVAGEIVLIMILAAIFFGGKRTVV